MFRTKWTVHRCHGQVRTRSIAFLKALVLIGHRETHPRQPSGAEPAQELEPERLALGLADIDADHLTPAGLVNRVGNHERFAADMASVSDLEVLGIEPDIRVLALERAVAKRIDTLVELTAQTGDPVL